MWPTVSFDDLLPFQIDRTIVIIQKSDIKITKCFLGVFFFICIHIQVTLCYLQMNLRPYLSWKICLFKMLAFIESFIIIFVKFGVLLFVRCTGTYVSNKSLENYNLNFLKIVNKIMFSSRISGSDKKLNLQLD